MDIIDKYPELEYAIVQYFVPPFVLAKLAYSQDDNIRYEVATKRRILLDTFELLSNDKNYTVRQRIAINVKCPIHILERLANDKHKDVAESALNRLNKRLDNKKDVKQAVS
ncbi:hypothetical protein E4T80_10445 [Muribacter muris]|uniref:HEAT repeat domain-containing protein n=1 Tax=Muribacter muris TaxID=67855 RepID=A0A4Y9JV10_9PAST|nr:hypothetical protein [Muribacter muris]MBF0785884.1 hypothetical protein [Muribacter muris]MBF0827202.1 hypothetical protein [Muribacter muris]TFV08325.1 hypothetical protein E4T80_10445 [Muribacter muris]